MATNSNATGGTRTPKTLYAVAAIVSLAGLADAIYLTVQHITGQSVRCMVISGCSEVLSSPYATLGGYLDAAERLVPVIRVLSSSYPSVRGYPLALFGAIAYFTVFSLAVLAAFRYPLVVPLLRLIVAVMFCMTLVLIYLQAFVIHHFCQFCLLSAAVTITLTIIVAVASRAGKN